MAAWEQSLKELVRARGPALVGYAYLLCGDRREAEDLVQDALVKTFARGRAGTRPENMEGYVRRAILTTFLDGFRRRNRWAAVRHLVAVPDVAPGHEAASGERADLRAALVPYAGDASAVDPASPPATPVLDIADVLVVTPGQELLPTFTRRASSYHQARVLEADFAGGTAKATLDAWVTEQTAGALTAMPWDPAPESMMVVLDAVTFAATWEHPFPAATDRPFTFGDGSQLPVRMMSQTLTTAYAADEGWQAVELPYSEGFVLRLALTSDGRAPAWATIDDRLDEAGDSAVEVVLPTWRTDSALSVRPMLRSIGLSAITRPGHLEDMAEAAVISGIGQMVSFSVGELGTMSGSAGAGDGGVTPAASIVLDRAFEYQVVHADTGMVVLAGRLVDPR